MFSPVFSSPENTSFDWFSIWGTLIVNWPKYFTGEIETSHFNLKPNFPVENEYWNINSS